MDARITKLEAIAEKTSALLAGMDVRMTRMESKQDEFARHYATRADILGAKNTIIVWVVSAVFLPVLLAVVAVLVKHYFS